MILRYLYKLFSECCRKKDEPKYTGHVDVIYK